MESHTATGSATFSIFDVKSEFAKKHHKYIIVLLPALSFLLWTISLIQARDVAMGDYGLFSVLPFTYYAAIFLLLASMFYTLFGPNQEVGKVQTYALLFQSFLLMIFILFTPSLIEGFARSPHSWAKYGYVDYIVRTGHIDQGLTHYHNWPVPFIFSAEIVQITGISPIVFPLIFPLVLDVILFVFIVLFFFKLFDDTKLRFLGISLFYLITWENQFHFAPQFFGFVIFVLILYLIIFYLKKENIKMLTVTGLMFMMLIMTHLLTAFVACLFLGLVVIYQVFWPKRWRVKAEKRRKMRGKWLFNKKWWRLYWQKILKSRVKEIMASKHKLMFLGAVAVGGLVVWFTFAEDWVRYANYSVDFGLIVSLTSAYVDKLYSGSVAHGNLVLIRMIFTAIIVTLAIIGGKLAYEKDKTLTMYIIIFSAVVPIFLFYYGVEIIQRAFLFCALPLAVLISFGLGHKKFLALILAFSFIFVPLHILSMYGNEKVDFTPPSQISGAQFIFDNVPDGEIYSGNPVERSQYIEKYNRIAFKNIDLYHDSEYDLYLVYSSSDEYFSLWYHGNEEYIGEMKNEISSDNYIKIFDSPDCQIYKYFES